MKNTIKKILGQPISALHQQKTPFKQLPLLNWTSFVEEFSKTKNDKKLRRSAYSSHPKVQLAILTITCHENRNEAIHNNYKYEVYKQWFHIEQCTYCLTSINRLLYNKIILSGYSLYGVVNTHGRAFKGDICVH